MFERVINFSNYQFNLHAMPVMAAGILIFLIGAFILLETKKTMKNLAFFFFCMSLSLWLIPISFVYLSDNPRTALWWYKHFVFLGVVNIMPNFYLFSVATAGFLKQQRHWVVAGFIISNIFYLLAITTNYVITGPTRYFWGYYPHYEPLTYLFFTVYGILFIASEVNLWVAYRSETIPIKKKHILTIFVGLLIGFMASFDFVAKIWSVPLYPFGFIPSFILSAMVAYSVIRHKAFDIETVIHKTILWVSSFSIITIPIFLLYRWSFPYMKESAFLQIGFGMATFVIFTIYLRLIQPKIDHLFQRRKADLEEISHQFISDLVHLKGLDNLIRRLEKTIANTLYPQWIDILIYDEKNAEYHVENRADVKNRASRFHKGDRFLTWLNKNDSIVYREFVEIDPAYTEIKDVARDYFKATGAMVVIPLVLNERLLGVIHLEKKANLRRYNAVDFYFLTTLKNQSAIAISNSLIYHNIEEQVKERTRELVEVQKQLIQAEKLATVGTLSGGVAHEINNPLTAILTNVQMLLAFNDKDAKIDRESLELIEEATQRCRTIVQKLMAYAKKPLESDQVAVIDMAAVLKKAAAFISYQLEQDSIQIVTQMQEGAYPVVGNQNELEQVLTNLILNARDATKEIREDGHIHIFLSKNKDQIKVDVRDDGIGIPKEILPKIFDPFFTTKDVGKGLGLGLSICQSIIDKHHGQITVQSELGKGTVFTVQFPQYYQGSSAGAQAAPTAYSNRTK